MPQGQYLQVFFIQRHQHLGGAIAGHLEQNLARLHQVARLGMAGEHGAGHLGADSGLVQLRLGTGQPGLGAGFLGLAGLQCARLQLGLFGGQAGQGFGLYRLFQRFVADGLLAGQQAAALEFTAGLLPLLLCLLRGPLGLW